MSAVFTPGSITRVSFLPDHSNLPDFSFLATVHNQLSFLKLDFVLPMLPVSPAALPALTFPCLKLDSMLWHHHFSHIGLYATRAALMKNYVKGVVLEGSFIHDHCIACIIGKSSQHLYLHHGHCATKIGEC